MSRFATQLQRKLISLMVLGGLILFALSVAERVFAHDQYHDWKIPGTTTSCCNDQDCAPTRARAGEDGVWEVWHEGRWLTVPASAILPFASPDGRSHACIIGSYVICFVPGEIRS